MAKEDQNTQFSGTAYEGILNNLPTDQSAGSESSSSPYANIDLGTTEKKEPKASVEIGPAIINQIAPAAVGAGMGTALSKYGTKPYELTPEFQAATSALTDVGIDKNAIQSNLSNINAAHTNSIGQLETTYADRLSELKDLEQKLNEARHRAEMLDALDFGERKVPGASMGYNYGAMMPGEKMPHKLLSQIEDMSKANPEGNAAYQIARQNAIAAAKQKAIGAGDYRLQGNLESELYVPPKPQVTPGEQRRAKKMYELAKAEHTAHLLATKSLADQLEKLKGSKPIEHRDASKALSNIEREYLKAKAKVESLTPSPGRIGQALNRIPGVEPALGALNVANQWVNRTPVVKHLLPAAGGALSSMQTLEGLEHWNKGQKVKGGLEMLSGLGGMVGTIPHPIARGVGLASQVPYLGYEGYEYLKDKLK